MQIYRNQRCVDDKRPYGDSLAEVKRLLERRALFEPRAEVQRVEEVVTLCKNSFIVYFLFQFHAFDTVQIKEQSMRCFFCLICLRGLAKLVYKNEYRQCCILC